MVEPGFLSSALPFTIGDAETAASSLIVTVQIVTDVGFVGTAPDYVLGGTAPNLDITIEAFAGSYGTATVSVTVTDGDGADLVDRRARVGNAHPACSSQQRHH